MRCYRSLGENGAKKLLRVKKKGLWKQNIEDNEKITKGTTHEQDNKLKKRDVVWKLSKKYHKESEAQHKGSINTRSEKTRGGEHNTIL